MPCEAAGREAPAGGCRHGAWRYYGVMKLSQERDSRQLDRALRGGGCELQQGDVVSEPIVIGMGNDYNTLAKYPPRTGMAFSFISA